MAGGGGEQSEENAMGMNVGAWLNLDSIIQTLYKQHVCMALFCKNSHRIVCTNWIIQYMIFNSGRYPFQITCFYSRLEGIPSRLEWIHSGHIPEFGYENSPQNSGVKYATLPWS